MGLKAKTRPNKYKKSRYAIVNTSKKEISKIIREFEQLPYKSIKRRSPNINLLTVTFPYQEILQSV